MLHVRFCVLEQLLKLPRGEQPECGEFLDFMSQSLNPISWMCLDFGVLGAKFASEPYVGVSGLVMALMAGTHDAVLTNASQSPEKDCACVLWWMGIEIVPVGCRNDTSR